MNEWSVACRPGPNREAKDKLNSIRVINGRRNESRSYELCLWINQIPNLDTNSPKFLFTPARFTYKFDIHYWLCFYVRQLDT